MLRAC